MATASRELLSSSVKSFLRKWVDEELDDDFKIKYTVDEVKPARVFCRGSQITPFSLWLWIDSAVFNRTYASTKVLLQ